MSKEKEIQIGGTSVTLRRMKPTKSFNYERKIAGIVGSGFDVVSMEADQAKLISKIMLELSTKGGEDLIIGIIREVVVNPSGLNKDASMEQFDDALEKFEDGLTAMHEIFIHCFAFNFGGLISKVKKKLTSSENLMQSFLNLMGSEEE